MTCWDCGFLGNRGFPVALGTVFDIREYFPASGVGQVAVKGLVSVV